MQDFFCAKLYANDAYKPCYKCLDSLLYAFVCPLIPKNKAYFKLFVKQYERMNLRRLLTKVDHVITSTDEQISFFENTVYQRVSVIKCLYLLFLIDILMLK